MIVTQQDERPRDGWRTIITDGRTWIVECDAHHFIPTMDLLEDVRRYRSERLRRDKFLCDETGGRVVPRSYQKVWRDIQTGIRIRLTQTHNGLRPREEIRGHIK